MFSILTKNSVILSIIALFFNDLVTSLVACLALQNTMKLMIVEKQAIVITVIAIIFSSFDSSASDPFPNHTQKKLASFVVFCYKTRCADKIKAIFEEQKDR